MKRLLHVIESNDGYLCDIEQYTEDPNEATTFVDYGTAIKRLISLTNKIKQDCWVGAVYVDFPHPIGYKNLIKQS